MRHIGTAALPLLLASFILSGICFSSEDTEEDFPKIGFIKDEVVDVRSGDNINFESLCRLRKGDAVKIIGKRYSWFKVLLPSRAYLYIKSEYVDTASKKGEGVVNALHVNLRAGPGTNYSIVGQVSKPGVVKVLSEEDGWSKIEPLEGVIGWIESSQVKFSMDDNIEEEVETEQRALLPRDSTPKNVKELTLEPPKRQGNLTFSSQSE
jgi:N-acetylmuramoyl-L-alanine amidase